MATEGGQLTARERGIAALVGEGLTNRAIAARLHISERTVEGHVLSIRNRLGLTNRTQVAAWHARETDEPLPAAPNNLPAQLTSFVGRQRELADVARLVRSTRLLTITGPGGCGKTRLALEVAGGLLGQYMGGAWFVDLAPLADPDRLAETVEAAAPPGPGDQRRLVLLDNCEHLLEGCGRLAEALLRSCQRLTLLCTSRAPLRVAGEVVARLGPLSPAPDAVQLFRDRAALSAPGLALDDEGDTAAVARIAQRLDCLPLALELAAGHVGLMPVAELQRHLDDRFVLSGRRGLVPRQRTLTATMDWSYDLLDEDERRLFRRLGVFGGSFTAEAAEAVCEVRDAVALLHRLADASLVAAPGPDGRYRLLGTVRRYCLDLLRRHDELEWLLRRHGACAQGDRDNVESLPGHHVG